MQQTPYFVVVLAHSLHGRLRRIHIPHQALYGVLILSLIGAFSTLAFLSSYVRMTWKVANYNSLRHEIDVLRVRYKELQKADKEKSEQLATLEIHASELSMIYGLRQKEDIAAAPATRVTPLQPSYRESLAEYNFLKAASFSRTSSSYAVRWQTNTRPSLWPVEGRIGSPFGGRSDPFSGEGTVHTGMDLSAPSGTPVRASADGIVEHADWSGRYGKLVVIGHANGIQTYYAHLSRFAVVDGQEIRQGELVGYSGGTGRVTSPHLHFEVRLHGTPVNPYPYLAKASAVQRRPAPNYMPF